MNISGVMFCAAQAGVLVTEIGVSGRTSFRLEIGAFDAGYLAAVVVAGYFRNVDRYAVARDGGAGGEPEAPQALTTVRGVGTAKLRSLTSGRRRIAGRVDCAI